MTQEANVSYSIGEFRIRLLPWIVLIALAALFLPSQGDSISPSILVIILLSFKFRNTLYNDNPGQ